jgi:hypothetical protein
MMTHMAKKRPADLNRLAASIARDTTEGEPEESRQARAGRSGGLKGGNARAAKLTKKRRSEIAKKAAGARWDRARS